MQPKVVARGKTGEEAVDTWRPGDRRLGRVGRGNAYGNRIPGPTWCCTHQSLLLPFRKSAIRSTELLFCNPAVIDG